MSGLYWSLTFLDLSGAADKLNKTEVIEFVKRNQHESGGFSPCDGHDPHLLYTLSALQVGEQLSVRLGSKKLQSHLFTVG